MITYIVDTALQLPGESTALETEQVINIPLPAFVDPKYWSPALSSIATTSPETWSVPPTLVWDSNGLPSVTGSLATAPSGHIILPIWIRLVFTDSVEPRSLSGVVDFAVWPAGS